VNLKGLPAKKSMKFVTLLLTAILIASVSAGTYLSLTMTSTVSVYQSNVYFVEGSDNNTAGAVLALDSTNTTATITGLRAYPNATFTYENVTLVRNNATSGTTNIRLTPDVNPSANPEDFEYVKFMLNGTSARWLNFTSNGAAWSNTGTTGWIQIPQSTQWPVAIMTKATYNATITDSVSITIKVDVD
jgi:hypothetical protein